MAFQVFDPRGFNTQVDYSGLTQGIGQLIQGQIANHFAKKAEEGDAGSMARLSSIDPRRAATLGSILDTRRQEQMYAEQQAAKQQQQQEEQKRALMGRIARGYTTAKDKVGYLSAAAANMDRAGFSDVADMIMVDLSKYKEAPGEVDQQYQAVQAMFGDGGSSEKPVGIQEFEYLVQQANSPDPLISQAAKIKLRTEAGATIDPDEYGRREAARLDAQMGRKAEIAGQTEQSKLGAQAAMRPQIEAETTKAVETARMDATGKSAEIEQKRAASMQMAKEAATLAREISAAKNLEDISGVSRVALGRLPKNQDLIQKAKRLESLLTVDNLKLMTGVLTDRDINFLTSIASGVGLDEYGFKGSKAGVQNRLAEIATKIEANLANQPAPSAAAPAKRLRFNPATGRLE